MSDRLDAAIEGAIAAGVLPADATRPATDARPWPVVLLTGLGAWIAAIPLMAVVGILLGDFISRGVGPYVGGLLLLGGALVILRRAAVSLFVEQLAVPALLAGSGMLGYALFRDFHARGGAIVLAVVAVAIAMAIPRAWLRVLWGAAAATLAAIALMPTGSFERAFGNTGMFWLSLHGLLGVWLGALAVQHFSLNDGERAPFAAAVEATFAGWVLVVLAGLAFASGSTFLLGGALGTGLMSEIAGELWRPRTTGIQVTLMQSVSLVLALVACVIAAQRWPALRQPVLAVVALVLCGLAWFLPSLGGVLLVLPLLVTTQRLLTAAAAAVAVAWIVGSFYYQLQWPLTTKAAVLAGAGALLAVVAWIIHPRRPGDAQSAQQPATAMESRPQWLIALALLATLAVANFAIWKNETLIARGQPVYVALAPADPRSLMQGDFMRLDFRMPDDVRQDFDALRDALRGGNRPHVVARRDARGIATLLRTDTSMQPLGADEFRIELAPKDGRWILVTDAWFFKEGEAGRWAAARFGEFRVLPEGKALLVGLADAQLHPIGH